MTFGKAIEALKQGELVSRTGWNGKRQFVFMRPADDIPATIGQNIKSLPWRVKRYFGVLNYKEGATVHFREYLCMKAADETIVNGWLASQTDMLADDWEIFNEY